MSRGGVVYSLPHSIMTATLASLGHSLRRSGSSESIYSIQGYETDFVRDTTDTESGSGHEDLEYEPVTDVDDGDEVIRTMEESSGLSDNDIITTKVIEVSVGDDGDLLLADSEYTALESSDSELDYHDYWLCANCRADNNDPTYRYCQKCFKVRQNLFPPRPKRKPKHIATDPHVPSISATLSTDSGIEMVSSQELSQSQPTEVNSIQSQNGIQSQNSPLSQDRANRKRRNLSVNSDHSHRKRSKSCTSESDTGSDSDDEVKTLHKSISDPSVTVEDIIQPEKDINKASNDETVASKTENDKLDNMCITCLSEPKSGVFVHGRIAHICCCYKCAVKVWRKAKRCPVCNSKVSNVLKAVVM